MVVLLFSDFFGYLSTHLQRPQKEIGRGHFTPVALMEEEQGYQGVRRSFNEPRWISYLTYARGLPG